MFRIVIVFVLLQLLFQAQAFSQTEVIEEEMKIDDAMEAMLNAHPYRFWIFRSRPHIFLRTGYDSNGLNSSTDPIEDYFLSLAPGGSFALRFGNRAFLEIEEALNFLYYNELEQRRDIFNTTAARFTTGTRRSLLTLRASYVKRKERIDSEFDVPANQEIINVGSRFEVAATPKLNVFFDFGLSRFIYTVVPDISNPFPPPPDNKRWSYSSWADYG